MAFTAVVYNVLIASPSDTSTFRDVVEQTLDSWNRDRAEGAGVVLRPLRWEFDTVPGVGEDAQSVINAQLVDKADILVGLFHARLGKATPRGPSGTAEEIEEAAKAGKPAHVYFSEMPIPHNVDPEELARLNEFRDELGKTVLYGSFASIEDLAARVRTAVERDVAELANTAIPGLTTASHAKLRAEYLTQPDRVRVTNYGDAKAEKVRLTFSSSEKNLDLPGLWTDAEPDIAPNGGHFDWLCTVYDRTAQVVQIQFAWTEEGGGQSDSHTVSFI